MQKGIWHRSNRTPAAINQYLAKRSRRNRAPFTQSDVISVLCCLTTVLHHDCTPPFRTAVAFRGEKKPLRRGKFDTISEINK